MWLTVHQHMLTTYALLLSPQWPCPNVNFAADADADADAAAADAAADAAAAAAATQLTRRFEASVRVCQYNDGPNQRPRDVGNIIEQEAAIRAQLKAEGTALAS